MGIAEDLRTAVLNLLDNAVKYSPDGVHVRCSLSITHYTWATLRITDTGVGLPADQHKRIFRRFYRVPGRTMQRIKGTGLGLFLVRNIARQHGGDAVAESPGLNQGTTVTLTLPLANAPATSGGHRTGRGHQGKGMSESPLIAVVEDEEHLAQGLLFNLQAEGYRTHHESDGDAALAWLLNPTEHNRRRRSRLHASRHRRLRRSSAPSAKRSITLRSSCSPPAPAPKTSSKASKPAPTTISPSPSTSTSSSSASNHSSAAPRGSAPQTSETPSHQQSRNLTTNTPSITAPSASIISNSSPPTAPRTSPSWRPTSSATSPSAKARSSPAKTSSKQVWRVHEDTDTRAIDNFIVRLRRYIEDDPANPQHLVTVRGIGYRFLANP